MTAPGDAFWALPLRALMEQTGSRPDGLTEAEAVGRLASFGLNAITQSKKKRLLTRIGKRFVDPLVAILLVAAAISGATGDLVSFAIIVVVISLSIILDVVQEQRAESAAEALKRSVAVHADVLRDKMLVPCPVERIVPGDVVKLCAGDLVPADGVVITSRSAHVNEALLTGEPFPVEKRAGTCEANVPADAFNALFAGTSLVSGNATMLVVTTGARTRFGHIAAMLESDVQPSALERGVNHLSLLILRLTSFLVLFVLLVQVALGRPVLDTFLFAVALAVGMTPELLPMIVTVTLSRGAECMAKERVIVKRLAAIHDLGAMDVLCTDKTGTLTEAQIALVAHPNCEGIDSDRVLALAGVNSRLASGIHSPLDQAIEEICPEQATAQWSKIDEIPFDFDRRRIAILAERGRDRVLIVKGAPEQVFECAASVELGDGSTSPLDALMRAKLTHIHDNLASQGQRLLAVAWKRLPAGCTEIQAKDEANLVFAGFCVFVDPPKMGAATAIDRLARQGIAIKVVSGDHEVVVRHLAGVLNIPKIELLTGAELAELSDAALAAHIEQITLFARVTPDQKTRIIRALQVRGHTVGFLGDGVNDAPAIRAAEVGLSVEGATDVARSAADMILLERNLGVVADGVDQGRRTLANILKYIRMGTSSNFGNMLSMGLASVVLPFLPLLPVQILLNNLLYDLSEIGIPLDHVDRNELERPRVWDLGGILRFTLIMGSISSLFDFATFAVLFKVFHVSSDVFRTAWFVESMATQILVIFIIRTWDRPWLSEPHPALVATSLGALCAALVVALTPLGHAFNFVVPPLLLNVTIAAIVILYLLVAEAAKSFARADLS